MALVTGIAVRRQLGSQFPVPGVPSDVPDFPISRFPIPDQ
jgi:hypothetical protein